MKTEHDIDAQALILWKRYETGLEKVEGNILGTSDDGVIEERKLIVENGAVEATKQTSEDDFGTNSNNNLDPGGGSG